MERRSLIASMKGREVSAFGAGGGCWSDILEEVVVEKGEVVGVVLREELVERMSEGVFGLVSVDEVVAEKARRVEMGRRRRAYIDGSSCWT